MIWALLALLAAGGGLVLLEPGASSMPKVNAFVRQVTFQDGTTRTIDVSAEVSMTWHAASAADYAALSQNPGYLLARELVISKLGYWTQGGLPHLDSSPDLVLLGLTEEDILDWAWPSGSIGAAIAEAHAEAPGAPFELLQDYGLLGTTQHDFEQNNVAHLPRFLLPLDAHLDVVDSWSVRPAPDQYGRNKPPGSPPAGLTLEGFKQLLDATETAVATMLGDARAMIRSASSSEWWSLARTGFALVPGLQAVSVGMAVAQAYGQGVSLGDAALSAGRAAIPAAAQPAWDIGVGIAAGKDATDAGIAAARAQLTNDDERTAFDVAVDVTRGGSPAGPIEKKALAEAQDVALEAVSSWW